MKIKNGIIFIFVCVIVLSSFKLPEVLLKMENNNFEAAIFSKEKNNIDIETQNIYLVKAIHEIESGKSIEISKPEEKLLFEKLVLNNRETQSNYEQELCKLQECKILKNVDFNQDSNGVVSILKTEYKVEDNIYEVNHIILKYENEKNNYVFNIESKTGKIIYIAFKKENIYAENNQKEILNNFINYLNLHVIDDWEYKTDDLNSKYMIKSAKTDIAIDTNTISKKYIMRSEKANISIALEETPENYMITFHTSN